jgi:uncharacterized membrane protein YeaQ/YmgE (transglycosylase-associated protein family)
MPAPVDWLARDYPTGIEQCQARRMVDDRLVWTTYDLEGRQTGGRMHIVWTILIGFVAGVVAKLLMPGKDPGGFVITTVLGIAGSLLATYGGQAIGWYQPGQGAGFIGAVVGAIILLAIYHFSRKSSS